jgi:hypothetical protein
VHDLSTALRATRIEFANPSLPALVRVGTDYQFPT